MATAVVLDGSRVSDDLNAAREALVGALGWHGYVVTVLRLKDMRLAPCTGCFGCWVKTPGVCVIDDEAGDVAREMIGSDLVVYLTPVTFGGYSSVLKRAVDRHICLLSPHFAMVKGEVHHRKRYSRYPRFAALGVLPRPDAEAEGIFAAVVERNARNNYAPAHAVTVVYGGQPEAEMAVALQGILQVLEVSK
ncbi:MAG: flavodoxin family protein [Anaerolineae bacterium]